MIKCSKCGAKHEKGDEHCRECGSELKITRAIETKFKDDLEGFIYTWKSVVLNPADFFRDFHGAKKEFDNAHYFVISVTIIGAFFYWVFIAKFNTSLDLVGMAALIGAFSSIIFVSFLFVTASKIVGGNASFNDTFRAMEYTYAPSIFFGFPVVGIIGSIYQVYLIWHGIKEVHGLSSGKTWFVVLSGLIVYTITVLIVLAVL